MKNLGNAELRDLLNRMNACYESLAWLGFERDLRQALADCTDASWIVWFEDVATFSAKEWKILHGIEPAELAGLPDIDDFYKVERKAHEEFRQADAHANYVWEMEAGQSNVRFYTNRSNHPNASDEEARAMFSVHDAELEAAGAKFRATRRAAHDRYLQAIKAMFVIED